MRAQFARAVSAEGPGTPGMRACIDRVEALLAAEGLRTQRLAVPDAPPFEPVEIWPGLADMAKLQKMLWAAKQPIILAGGGFKHGQHLAFDPDNPPPLCNMFVSLLQKLGIDGWLALGIGAPITRKH